MKIKILFRLLATLVFLPMIVLVCFFSQKAFAVDVPTLSDQQRALMPPKILEKDGGDGFAVNCDWLSSAHFRCFDVDYRFDPVATEQAGHVVFAAVEIDRGNSVANEWGYIHFTKKGEVFLWGYVSNSPTQASDVGFRFDHFQTAIEDKSKSDDKAEKNACAITNASAGCMLWPADKNKSPGSVNWDKVKEITEAAISSQQALEDCGKDSGALGFFICPVYNWINNAISDMVGIGENGGTANGLLIDLMTVPPISVGEAGVSDGIYKVWSMMKDLALGMYVVIFLVALFANTLSLGVDSYTIKKTLPRLVAGAIFTQFSFLIVAVLVDISNVVGTAIPSLILQGGDAANSISFAFESTALGGAMATLGILMLIILAVLALISLLIALFTFLARQLIVFALVIVAPFAFLLWILPNTEKLYQKWWSNLIKVLMMYPIATGIVSLSLLFASTIQNTDASDALKIFGALIPMIALVLLPKTFKWGGEAFGAVGGWVASKGAGAQKAVATAPGKMAKAGLKAGGRKALSSETASKLGTSLGSSRVGRMLGGTALMKKAQSERSGSIDRAEKLTANMGNDQLFKVAQNGNRYERAAAIGALAKRNDRQSLIKLGAMGGTTAQAYNDASSRYFGDFEKNADLRRVGGNYTDMTKQSPEMLAKLSDEAYRAVVTGKDPAFEKVYGSTGKVAGTQMAAPQTIQRLSSDARLGAQLTDEKIATNKEFSDAVAVVAGMGIGPVAPPAPRPGPSPTPPSPPAGGTSPSSPGPPSPPTHPAPPPAGGPPPGTGGPPPGPPPSTT